MSRQSGRRHVFAAILGSVLAAMLVLAGCGGSSPADHAAAAPRAWAFWGRSPENTHYAAHVTIEQRRTAAARLAPRRGAVRSGLETFPVVVGRTMFFTTNTDEVRAVDAVMGRLVWSYTPLVEFVAAPGSVGVDPTSRGAGRSTWSTATRANATAPLPRRRWVVTVRAPTIWRVRSCRLGR